MGNGDALKGHRDVVFDADVGPVSAPVFDRYRLAPGFETQGPAIVEEAESTTVAPPGWSLAVDASGSLLLQRVEGSR